MIVHFENPWAQARWREVLGSDRLPDLRHPVVGHRVTTDLPQPLSVTDYQVVIAGTDPFWFRDPVNSQRVHSLIGRELAIRPAIWSLAGDLLIPLLGMFLGDSQSCLSLVTFINRRRAFLFRGNGARLHKLARSGITKHGRMNAGKSRALAFADVDFSIPAELSSLVLWHRRIPRSRLARIGIHRAFLGEHIIEHRTVLLNSHDDHDLATLGAVPALVTEGLSDKGKGTTEAPLVTLLRTWPTGFVDIWNIEIHPEAGTVLDFRESRQSLEYHLLADPNNIEALLVTMREGVPL